MNLHGKVRAKLKQITSKVALLNPSSTPNLGWEAISQLVAPPIRKAHDLVTAQSMKIWASLMFLYCLLVGAQHIVTI